MRLVWLEGGYTTKWKTARMKVGRRMVDWVDTVRRSTIFSGLILNKNSKLDTNEKGPLRAKRIFLQFFKPSPRPRQTSPGLSTWFVCTLVLLLHKSKVRIHSKPRAVSGQREV